MNRPDASMSLLTDVAAGALEPEYRAHQGEPVGSARLAVTIALIAVLLTVALLQTTRGAGAASSERQELLERISEARQRQSELSEEATRLDQEVSMLGEQALGDPGQREELALLNEASGAVAMTGPGIVIEVNDAPGAADAKGLVLDGDLTRLVNGLWEAGAEAISINGRRLSVLTAIRSAGAAITVDYVSLAPPYRLEVIGDPRTLQARFNETSAAGWWHFLTQNYALSMTISQSEDDLDLPADPGMTLRFAKPN